jgi:hypothetical protein
MPTLFFGSICSLWSSTSALSNRYQGISEWLEGNADSFKHGALVLNESGLWMFDVGFFIVGALCVWAFVNAFLAYRRNRRGKKLMICATLLFGVAILVIALSITIDVRSSCYENPEGSDDTVYCTYVLPTYILPMVPFVVKQ